MELSGCGWRHLAGGFAGLRLFVYGDAVRVDGVLDGIGWERLVAFHHGAQPLRAGISLHELGLGKRHSGEVGEAGVQGGVVDRLRVELGLEPALQADAVDLLRLRRGAVRR